MAGNSEPGLRDFALDAGSGVWVHPSSSLIDYSDGVESEQYLETVLRECSDLSSDSLEIAYFIRDWPSRYHLSSARASLMRWFPFNGREHVLEIGCGNGAVTRFLGECAGEVQALEGSFARARIAALRCRGLDGTRIYAGDMSHVDLTTGAPPGGYDLVTLIGVLEYVGYRSEADPVALLSRLREVLSPDGVLCVAIENKVGLKYLAGCREDHTGVFYDGIHDYASRRPVRTYSRRELETVARHAGFERTAFLCPFPDYKLPRVLINAQEEERIARLTHPENFFALMRFEDYGGVRTYNFNERLAVATFARAGMLGEVANSFLMIAGGKEPWACDEALAGWALKSFSTGRRPPFCTHATLTCDGRMVKRFPGSPDLQETQLLDEPMLYFLLLRAMMGPNPRADFLALLREWALKMEGWGPPEARCLVDCTPWNIVVKPGGAAEGDGEEWIWFDRKYEEVDFLPKVSVQQVLFRGTLFLLGTEWPWAHALLPGTTAQAPAESDLGSLVMGLLGEIGYEVDSSRLDHLVGAEAAFQATMTGGDAEATAETIRFMLATRVSWLIPSSSHADLLRERDAILADRDAILSSPRYRWATRVVTHPVARAARRLMGPGAIGRIRKAGRVAR